jgi:hypothetical protein
MVDRTLGRGPACFIGRHRDRRCLPANAITAAAPLPDDLKTALDAVKRWQDGPH